MKSQKSAFGPAKQKTLNINRLEDKYYTKEEVAQKCFGKIMGFIDTTKPVHWIEPSVGAGAFEIAFKNQNLGELHKITTIDVDCTVNPQVCVDFLSWKHLPPPQLDEIVVFGNPPFGKNASTALKFVNKAALFANLIAFILPLSFDKTSVFNRVDRHLHLIFEQVLEKNSFTFEGKERDVPCKFYIFKRELHQRELIPVGKSESQLVSFVKPEICTLMVQRVGQKAGQVWFNTDKIKEKSSSRNYYFVRISKDLLDTDKLLLLNNMSFENCVAKRNTSGMPSISKPELVQMIHDYLKVTIE